MKAVAAPAALYTDNDPGQYERDMGTPDAVLEVWHYALAALHNVSVLRTTLVRLGRITEELLYASPTT